MVSLVHPYFGFQTFRAGQMYGFSQRIWISGKIQIRDLGKHTPFVLKECVQWWSHAYMQHAMCGSRCQLVRPSGCLDAKKNSKHKLSGFLRTDLDQNNEALAIPCRSIRFLLAKSKAKTRKMPEDYSAKIENIKMFPFYVQTLILVNVIVVNIF